MSTRPSLTIAAGVSIVITLAGLIIGLATALLFFYSANSVFPAEAGETPNLLDGSMFGFHLREYSRSFMLLLASILFIPLAVFITVMAWLMERRFKNAWKMIAVSCALGGVMCFNFFNFISLDALINIYAQFMLDFGLICISTYVIMTLLPLRTKGQFLRITKSVLIGLLFFAGMAIPGLFVLMFVAWKLNIIENYHLQASDYMIWVAGMLALAWVALSYMGRSPSSTFKKGERRHPL